MRQRNKQFLYIDPLKQGLKHRNSIWLVLAQIVFIHRSIKTRIETRGVEPQSLSDILFLYIDPLKQGLKLKRRDTYNMSVGVFIHRSIKTRIETKYSVGYMHSTKEFLYIDPLKQGLKLAISMSSRRIRAMGFYT